jgi:hypothetical protein
VVNYVDLSPDKSILAIGWGSDKIQTLKTSSFTNEEPFEGCCYSKANGT